MALQVLLLLHIIHQLGTNDLLCSDFPIAGGQLLLCTAHCQRRRPSVRFSVLSGLHWWPHGSIGSYWPAFMAIDTQPPTARPCTAKPATADAAATE